MTFGLKRLMPSLKRFRKSEDGGPTLEFVVVFLPFIIIPVIGFELGLLMTRHGMLERGLSLAVRELRLSTDNVPSYVQFRDSICAGAAILPDCSNNLRLEMRAVDMFGADPITDVIPVNATCTVVDVPFELANVEFEGDQAVPHQLMIVRACGAFSPMLPTFGLGALLSSDDGLYRVVSSSAFVMEPF